MSHLTVKQLKEIIAALPDSMDNWAVVMQKDLEGNGYAPIAGIDQDGCYYDEGEGAVYGPGEDEIGEICIVLFPLF